MKYKKGDLVKVIEVAGVDEELYGIIKGETYEVLYLCTDGDGVEINAGRGNRLMYSDQIKKVKKKSKKDLKIEELENEIREMKNRLELLVINN